METTMNKATSRQVLRLESKEEMEDQIPVINLSGDRRSLEPGTEQWAKACQEVRQACEALGCFRVAYDGVPSGLRESMFEAMKPLFDLPLDTKKKNTSTKPYFGYAGDPNVLPLYESLGVEEATDFDTARSFCDLMWPAGNPEFCETLNSMSRRMLELELIIRRMIFDSFGAGKYFESHVENTSSVFRVMKYKPPVSNDKEIGLLAHTDKNMLTILCEDDVQGLQVLSKEDEWLEVNISKGSFAVIVGDTFKVWSNGRFLPAKHRVMMRGEKERYSCGIFSVLKEGYIMEIPPELVDKEHPLLFKPFNFMEFLSYFYSNLNAKQVSENALEIFSGI